MKKTNSKRKFINDRYPYHKNNYDTRRIQNSTSFPVKYSNIDSANTKV